MEPLSICQTIHNMHIFGDLIILGEKVYLETPSYPLGELLSYPVAVSKWVNSIAINLS